MPIDRVTMAAPQASTCSMESLWEVVEVVAECIGRLYRNLHALAGVGLILPMLIFRPIDVRQA
jgi:hypothetical protein